jgi:FMN phosphatase YigB (HAD superfamily)
MRYEAVTFDCWGTLLYETDPAGTWERRVGLVAEAAARAGLGGDPVEARAALDAAFRRHWALWREGIASGASEMAAWALAELAERRGVPAPDPALAGGLARGLADALLAADVRPLPEAGATLERLAARGIRRALVCDTGFAGGDVVRPLLARTGLLAWLEVTVFSDEAGVPKPSPIVFGRALEPLGVAARPAAALHVGDLRRTDVAGGRGFGMATLRIRGHYDDPEPLPEADLVADSHAHVRALLDLA